MAEEKIEKHEHHENKTVSIKKSTLWGVGVFVLLALLVASVFTGGFGIMKSNNASTGNAAANTANTATGATAVDPSIFSDSSLFPKLGPSNAKYTVIEVADFQCPYCALASGLPSWSTQYASQYGDLIGAAGNVEQLAQQGKVQFIFVPWSFLDATTRGSGTTQESTWAAEAGFCALDQGKFWQMHDAIYTASDGPNEDTGKYTKANLTVLAQDISGMDMTKFNTCLNTDADLAKVQQVEVDVQKSGVTGTPMFFVNGQNVQASWTAIKAAIGQ